jgi:BlaI family transcriptional regulator, penicillinase repressor
VPCLAGEKVSDISPSQRELDVLKVLWDIGEAKVRDVHEAMCRQEKCAFTTVQTLLRIMADKGLVKPRAEGRTLYYSPVYTRERSSSHFLHRVFDGALDKLVLNMLTAEDVSSDEMRELERLIAKARREKQSEE